MARSSHGDRDPAPVSDRATDRSFINARLRTRVKVAASVVAGVTFAGLWYGAICWLAWLIL